MPKGSWRDVPLPDATVKRLRELWETKGYGYRAIADTLNEEGIPKGPNAYRWNPEDISFALAREGYGYIHAIVRYNPKAFCRWLKGEIEIDPAYSDISDKLRTELCDAEDAIRRVVKLI